MSRALQPLSYQARRALLVRVAPRYREASPAQKTLLLDSFIELTGYARKYAIGLLNQAPEKTALIRPRLPLYGPEVQQALFLAWKAARYICAKRLIPFLPTLVASLEQHGHLQLHEEHRRQLMPNLISHTSSK